MSFQRVPLEISDMIIDFCHGDKRTLRSCALVCRSWSAAAQYHILYSTRLTAEPKKGGYAVQLRPLLAPPNCTRIRELALTPGPSRYSPLSELKMDVLLSVLTSLQRLRSLCLSETGFVESSDAPSLSSTRFRLDKLQISWMYSTSPGTSHGFQDVLSIFSDLRDLHLGPIHAKHLPVEPDNVENPLTTKVDTMTLLEVSRPLVTTLSRLICPERLNTVKACITASGDVSQLGTLLHNIGSELVQFQLAIWNFWFSDIIDWAALNLDACPKLQSVVVLYANAGVFYSWQTVLDILTVVTPTITELTIVVRESDCFNTLNWSQMEQRLWKFTKLKKLSFRLCRGGDPFRSREVSDDIMEQICGALSNFKASNVLCK